MIGAILITHGTLSQSLLDAAEGITGSQENVHAISIGGGETTEGIRTRLKNILKEADRGEGVIIFTDMFGGTPTNIALSFLETGAVEIITGVNLPLILKFLNNRKGAKLKDLSAVLAEHGQKSIVLASSMLRGKTS